MAQQAQFKKLKEQIEAAKRGLTEMSDAEIDHSPTNLAFTGSKQDFSTSTSTEIAKAKQINTNSGDALSSDSFNTRVVDMTPKTVVSDTPFVDDKLGKSANSLANEFQFFYRGKQLKGKSNSELGASFQEADNAESEALLFEQFDRRLDTLEGDVEQNRKYILELINLLSQLDLRQRSANRKLKPSQRLIRRHIFWIVIGFLAVGWFGLTPSGHIAVKHFLTLI